MFPDKLKIAKVTTFLKKDDYRQTSNYRRISLLSIFSNLFERAMYIRLFKFFELHKSLYNLHFGFQENNLIDHALISLRYVCSIFIDLQKAFGTVNHQILLSKMGHYGLCKPKWFQFVVFHRGLY